MDTGLWSLEFPTHHPPNRRPSLTWTDWKTERKVWPTSAENPAVTLSAVFTRILCLFWPAGPPEPRGAGWSVQGCDHCLVSADLLSLFSCCENSLHGYKGILFYANGCEVQLH